MKKIVLSSLAALTLGSVAASASDLKLYQDANGQVYTQAGADRTEIKASTPVFSHADKLKFSGLTYLGYRYDDRDKTLSTGAINTSRDTSGFEIRRGYFQLKAYLLDDPKSYFRVTYDLTKDAVNDTKVRAKYAYLYLNEVLPATGLEIGLVHRPWHDYEEHNSWYFRDISKVLIESKRNGDLSNSADFGAMLKTRTQYFDADYGIFNGEGYHGAQATTDVSFEWRATAHILGVDGKDAQNKKTYFDASFYGQYNKAHKAGAIAGEYDDLIFYGFHTVYNQPSFLLSAQYVTSQDTADNGTYVSKQAGSGYSFNGEYRLGNDKEYRILGRYDSWTPKANQGALVVPGTKEYEKKSYIAGLAWDQNKNVQWVANVIVTDNDGDTTNAANTASNGTQYMLTAQVEF
jgi:hypothetical protein